MNHNKLVCYRMSVELAKTVPALTRRWPLGHGYLVDQLKRAISSVALNIAEGNSRYSPKERARFFNIARASVSEVSAIFDIAFALELISQHEQDSLQDKLTQISKILYRLREIAFNPA